MKKKFFKRVSYAVLATVLYLVISIQTIAQNPPTQNPVPPNPYPAGLPSPVQPVPPPGLKTDTMSIPRPVKPQPFDTIKTTPNEITPAPDTVSKPVPKRKK